MEILQDKAVFETLFQSSLSLISDLYHGQVQEEKEWNLADGKIRALQWSSKSIPKTGLSFLERRYGKEATYRVGLHMYVQNPEVPDGSFAILLARQDDFHFIGGVIELFPSIRIEEDIEAFKHKLNNSAKKHGMDYHQLRKGLIGTFTPEGEKENLGAEAGFNFYRADLEATASNLNFTAEVFAEALDEFIAIMARREGKAVADKAEKKETMWHKHLLYMKKQDIGIKMALEQGLPMEFFAFSTFPPVE